MGAQTLKYILSRYAPITLLALAVAPVVVDDHIHQGVLIVDFGKAELNKKLVVTERLLCSQHFSLL